MAKYTNKFKLGYFEVGDTTDGIIESKRWLTIDQQMSALFEVLGDGVITGWDFVIDDVDQLLLSITPGSGHAGSVAVESVVINSVALSENARNYIYAYATTDSYYTKNVLFTASLTESTPLSGIFLGYVDTDYATASPVIKDTNIDDRVYISFKQQILNLIKDHRHIGGTLNPTKINLATDVQGFLRGENIDDLDASFILTGTIDEDRLPQIDHITGLSHTGVLTHAQLDTFVQILNQDGARLMGEISSTDLLKLILAVKHVYPEIDDYLVNELAFIPGISPATIVDQVKTTAVVDYRTAAEGGDHTIKGTPADSVSTFTKKWEDESLNEAVLSDLVVVGDSIKINTRENRAFIDDFEDVSDWETVTTDMSSIDTNFVIDSVLHETGIASGKVTVATEDAEIAFVLKKTFSSQDWSGYDKISFKMYCDTAKHGDIYFYLYDAVAGSQGSYKMVLERNSPTIDRDTLGIGWREMIIDISSYTRTKITSVGFYTSTSSGWNIEDSFSFNVDNMFLTSGNVFLDRGTAIFSYGNDFQYTFSAIRWEASVPDDTRVLVRTRVSDLEDMSGAYWSAYLTESGDAVLLPGLGVYKYIDIEVTLESDTTHLKSPQLYALYLDCTAVSSEQTFEFDNKDAWESGSLWNVDTETVPGSIKIKTITDLGTYIYSSDGVIRQLNSDLTTRLSIYGSNVPPSFVQMVAGTSVGFGQISAIDVGLRDSFLVADTDNDRVLEIDKNGEVLWGLMGVFTEIPANPLLTETTTANTATATTATTAATTTVAEEFLLLGCYYNVEESCLYAMFNVNLENVYTSTTFDPTNIFLKAGVRRIYMDINKCIISLFGVNEDLYSQIFEKNDYLAGSNVLKIVLSESDAVTISGVAASEDPYLTVSSPKVNEVITSSSPTIQFEAYNCTLGAEDFGIRLQIDGGATIDLRTVDYYDTSGLADGTHVLYAYLIDENGSQLANEGCSVIIKFYVETGVLSETVVSILSLTQNQIVESSVVSVDFINSNIPANYYFRYVVDDENYVQYDDVSPLEISGLSGGAHSVRFYLSDINNVVLAGDLTDVTVDFVVVNRTSAAFSLVVGVKSIKSKLGTEIGDTVVPIYITKIKPANIYAPVDVRLLTTDSIDGDTESFDVLIAKVATPSYLNYYQQTYRDGYSVVQYSDAGVLMFSDKTAAIADTKEKAKQFLGGASKYGEDELFIADAYGKRALVIEVDSVNKTSSIVWEYDSDRVVSDFNRVPDAYNINDILDSGIANDSVYIRRDMSVTWYNNTNETIRILSGATDYDQFYLDPDFNLFGSEFDSGDILPGQYYSFRFLNLGTFDYFVYPFIYTGQVYALETSVTPNDTFVIVENDPNGSSYLNRVAKVDAWGNIIWSFGDSFASLIKDARPVSSTEIVLTV